MVLKENKMRFLLSELIHNCLIINYLQQLLARYKKYLPNDYQIVMKFK